MRPDALDPDPSPLLGNFVGALRHPLRVAAPMVRRGWLERGPGPDPRAAMTRSSQVAGTRCSTGSPPSWPGRRRARPGGGVRRLVRLGQRRAVPPRAEPAAPLPQLPRRLRRRAAPTASARRRCCCRTDLRPPRRSAAVADRVAAARRAHRAARVLRRRPGEEPGGRPGRGHARTARSATRGMARRGRRGRAGRARTAPTCPPGSPPRWLPLRARHRHRADAGAVPRPGRRGPARRRVPRPLLRGRRRGVGLRSTAARRRRRRPREWAEAISGVPAATIVALARRDGGAADDGDGDLVAAARRARRAAGLGGGRARRAAGPDRPARRRLRLRLRLDGATAGCRDGVGPAAACRRAQPRAHVHPGRARRRHAALQPGAPYDYDGERHRYPHIELVYWCGGNPFHHHQDLGRLRRAFGG